MFDKQMTQGVNMTELAAGYIELPGMAIHVSKVREHTADIHRLKRHLPLLIELEATAPGTPEAHAILSKVDSIQSFQKSMIEVAELLQSESERLQGAA
jgi:hypothetical protein